MSQRVNFNLLDIIYIFGIIITGVLALTLLKDSPQTILILGIVHLCLLIYLGYQLLDEPYRLMSAAAYIQTTGYLHTLIGFIMAISLLQQEDQFEIKNLAIPLSNALITRLIGWFFGGYFSLKGETDNPNLQQATSDIVNTLKGYSQRIKYIEQKYINIYEQILSRIQEIEQEHNNVYQQSSSSIEQIYTQTLDQVREAHESY